MNVSYETFKYLFSIWSLPLTDIIQSIIAVLTFTFLSRTKFDPEAGFRVGTNTPYRYVIIHIKYSQSIINDIYGEQITMTRTRPKYKIGTYQIATNKFAFQSRSISLYRVRHHELQSIFKGNLHWPQTFYQLPNSIDIQANDYLIGTCIYEHKSSKYLRYV
ncbi:unnamed protein product [Rotaria sp. Silwood1]|nr:unnamed protein product [Rotaria sp. Silwood1]